VRSLAATALIFTVAGTGTPGNSGDGGPATQARVSHPRGIDAAADGSFLFAEPYANRVRLVGRDGRIATVVGTGAAGFGGDGGPATRATLNFVHGVALLRGGGYLVADTRNQRIRRVSSDGDIRTVAGNGTAGFGGDGGSATAASIAVPRGVAAERVRGGGFLIPDTDNRRIRRVRDGVIRTVAGNGRPGARAGDGGPATRARMSGPFGVSARSDGGFYISDAGANVVRLVSRAGRITTVAGTGRRGFSGDGGPATRARLAGPHNLYALADGGLLIADTLNHRLRRVLPNGRIETVAGTGRRGYSGDGGRATRARLDQPKAVAETPDGGILVGDAENDVVRWVAPVNPRRLAVAVPGGTVRARAGKPVAVPVVATLAASLRVTVSTSSGRALATATAAGKAGSATITVPDGLEAGPREVSVVARTADGQVSTAGARLVVR
jgi:NHL repeat-containing protein